MLLLTSFTTWQAHQATNASDDLLAAVSEGLRPALGDRDPLPGQLHYLRQLPVDFAAAPAQIIAAITALKPEGVVLCGMAEGRSHLSVESNGCNYPHSEQVLHTSVPLERLIAPCAHTHISHDAGQFVCGHTYYEVLHHLGETIPCIFVHVPLLTLDRRNGVIQDFIVVLQQMLRLTL
ncbi:MAG: peptidase C15 [Cyanobacteria bacterium]|nr:peptidase C15 [Cyanobacteriota bacterium]MDA0866235.1 peptidase C15 [Cyanobacteriota bacterium]